jgi:hypothetical protein
MPVDFCAHNEQNCTTPDIVTPFVWCQYLRPRDEANLCKDVVVRYLRSFDGDGVPEDQALDPENNTGMRDLRIPEHRNGVARWLGKSPRKGVAGKPTSNLFVVFVEVVGKTVI